MITYAAIFKQWCLHNKDRVHLVEDYRPANGKGVTIWLRNGDTIIYHYKYPRTKHGL